RRAIMAGVTLTRSECDQGRTPTMCLVCGQASAQHQNVTLVNQNQFAMASHLTGVGGMQPGCTALLPLCPQHADVFSSRGRALVPLLCLGGFFLTFVVAGVGVLIFSLSGKTALGMLVCFLPGFLVAAGLVVGAVLHYWIGRFTKVTVTQVNERGVTLTNISDRFVDALEAHRGRAGGPKRAADHEPRRRGRLPRGRE